MVGPSLPLPVPFTGVCQVARDHNSAETNLAHPQFQVPSELEWQLREEKKLGSTSLPGARAHHVCLVAAEQQLGS